MKKIAFVVAAIGIAVSGPSFAAAKSSSSVCANHALSAQDQKDCKSAVSHAKGKAAKDKVRTEYQAKVDAAKKH